VAKKIKYPIKQGRVYKRGTIRWTKSFRPDSRLLSKKRKTLAILANRRQSERDFDPIFSTGYEIEAEHLSGYYFITEGSSSSSPNYIITE